MLYTSYIDKLKDMSNDITKIIVMRYIPKINILLYDNLYIDKTLSPSETILNEYNESERTIQDWRIFKDKFNDEIVNRLDLNKSIKKLAHVLQFKDVVILCHEINGDFCHRTLIAKYLQKHFNIKWKEF